MSDIFLNFVNRSIAASWVALVVIALRLLFRKGPKWLHCALWAAVAIRLLCPVSIESSFSLLPDPEPVKREVVERYLPELEFETIANRIENREAEEAKQNVRMSSALSPIQVLCLLWLVGMAAMFLYAVLSYRRLHRQVKTAVRLRDNLYQSENVTSPFVLGLTQPRIYLPFQMKDKNLDFVIAHEETHIRRGDHWFKSFGFFLLSLYWFQPILWMAYILFCRDMEVACDEGVSKDFEADARADYAQALLSCSISWKKIAPSLLTFGEVGIKKRVRSVLSYKKPTVWMIVTAVMVCIAAVACFLTDPKVLSLPFEDMEIIKVKARDMRPTEPVEFWLSQAECDELKYRLQHMKVGEKEKTQFGFTAVYGLYIQTEEQNFMLVSYETEGKYTFFSYEDHYYQVRDEETISYLNRICAGKNRTSASPAVDAALTLENVTALSQKGEELSWQDFDDYFYIETGSGLYIRIYEIDSQFSLWIGGGSVEEKPMYIRLIANGEAETYIDIRRENVADFIQQHKGETLDRGINEADQ